ncbi:MAG TPA: hypothetical protein VHN20_04395 [Beijerinckiaceae bacterium]|nr:hypothetical protein [Beijerinckiaceae bacterium]
MSEDKRKKGGRLTDFYLVFFAIFLIVAAVMTSLDIITLIGIGVPANRKYVAGEGWVVTLIFMAIGFAGTWFILYHRGWRLRDYMMFLAIIASGMFACMFLLMLVHSAIAKPLASFFDDEWAGRIEAMITALIIGTMTATGVRFLRSRGWIEE